MKSLKVGLKLVGTSHIRIYPHFVVPAKAGTHKINHIDSRLRGNDELLEVP